MEALSEQGQGGDLASSQRSAVSGVMPVPASLAWTPARYHDGANDGESDNGSDSGDSGGGEHDD